MTQKTSPKTQQQDRKKPSHYNESQQTKRRPVHLPRTTTLDQRAFTPQPASLEAGFFVDCLARDCASHSLEWDCCLDSRWRQRP